MHSRIGFDFSEFPVALEFGFPTDLAQCTLHSLFLLYVSFSLPFLLFFGPLVIHVKVRGEALG